MREFLADCPLQQRFLAGRQIADFVFVVYREKPYLAVVLEVEVQDSQTAPFALAAPRISPTNLPEPSCAGHDSASFRVLHESHLQPSKVLVVKVRLAMPGESWPFDKDQYLILNLALGGAWGGQQGIDDSIFPQKFCVDYVRVYQKRN